VATTLVLHWKQDLAVLYVT